MLLLLVSRVWCASITVVLATIYLLARIYYTPPPLASANVISSGIAVLTGGTGGFGLEISTSLALAGLDVVLACRPGHEKRCNNVTHALWSSRGVAVERRIYVESVDLASCASTNDFVQRVSRKYAGRMRALVNAAGIGAAASNSESTRDAVVQPVHTVDGFEQTFHVNVLSYYMLCVGLLPALRASGRPSSVVNVASENAVRSAFDIDDLHFSRRPLAPYDGRPYQQSKMAERLLTWQLHDLYGPAVTPAGEPAVYWNAVHPGVNGTRLYGAPGALSHQRIALFCSVRGVCNDLKTGAQRPVWLATKAPAARVSGTMWSMMPTPGGPLGELLWPFFFPRLPGELPGTPSQSRRVARRLDDANLRGRLWSRLQRDALACSPTAAVSRGSKSR